MFLIRNIRGCFTPSDRNVPDREQRLPLRRESSYNFPSGNIRT
jgi:hypothetical protein